MVLQSFSSLLPLEFAMKKLPLPTDQYVGNRVRMRRLMLDLSQTELATAVGVTFQQVQNMRRERIVSALAVYNKCRRC